MRSLRHVRAWTFPSRPSLTGCQGQRPPRRQRTISTATRRMRRCGSDRPSPAGCTARPSGCGPTTRASRSAAAGASSPASPGNTKAPRETRDVGLVIADPNRFLGVDRHPGRDHPQRVPARASIWGAKQRANVGRHQATSGDGQPWFPQVDRPSGHIQPHASTERTRLKTESQRSDYAL
jgi:hypothetical protein